MFSKPKSHSARLRLLAGSALGSALAVAASSATAQQAGNSSSIQLPTLSVEGAGSTDYKVEQPSLNKLTQPLLDTPQSIDTVSRQLMDDRGATTLSDALRNVPGISLGAGESSWLGTNITLRGFNARNDMYLDGMRDFASYYRDPFNLEEVEVLEGPSSMLFGRGSTGGVVNQVSKTPGLQPHVMGDLSLGTDETRRLTADIDEPLPELGDGTAFRFTAMGHDSMVADRDVAEFKRYGFAPSFAVGLGSPTRLTVSYFHQTEDNTPDYGIPWLRGAPAPVPRNNYYGFTSDFNDIDYDVGTVKLEHDYSDAITVRDQIRYASDYTNWRNTEPQTTGVLATTPLSAIAVTRAEQSGHARSTFLQNQTDVTAKFMTGEVGHTLVAGIEVGPESLAAEYDNTTGVPSTPLLTPNESQLFAGTNYPRLTTNTPAFTVAAYAIDTVKFDEQWELTGGVRWDRFSNDYHSTAFSAPPATLDVVTGYTTDSRVDSAPSYRAALVYKPLPNGSVYADYGTSFDPSAEQLSEVVAVRSFNTGNLFLAPEKNRTYEVGTKWDVMDAKLRVTASLFREEKYNARIPNPANSAFNILGGDFQVDGGEFDVIGHVTDEWQITAGYTYLDGHVVKSDPGGPAVGAGLFNTPKNSISLWTTYKLVDALEIGGGVAHISSRIGSNTTVPYEVAPGYTTFDAMARYQLTQQINLQVNVYNVTDAYYYDALHGFHVVPGAGRSALFTLGFKL